MCQVIVYYSTSVELWTQPRYESLSLQIPAGLRKRINGYKDPLGRQSMLLGKLQLLALLKDFKLYPQVSLDQFCYSGTNRPYFPSPGNFDFNISHSGKMVLCGAGLNVRIGLDIEEVKSVDLREFKSGMSPAEWEFLLNAKDPERNFYKYWTKNEALLKAVGVGLMEEASKAERGRFFLRELQIPGNYVAHAAVSDANAELVLREFFPAMF
jgi:4'-phosphopantetheinyl transferase